MNSTTPEDELVMAWVWCAVPKLVGAVAIYALLELVAPRLLEAAQCRTVRLTGSTSRHFLTDEPPYPWMCHAVDAVFLYPFVLYWLLPDSLPVMDFWAMVFPCTWGFCVAGIAGRIVTATTATKMGHGRCAVVAIHTMNWAAGMTSAAMLYALWSCYDFDSMGAHVAFLLTAMLVRRVFTCLLRFHRRIVYSPFSRLAMINDALLNFEHNIVRSILNTYYELLYVIALLALCGMVGRLTWCSGIYVLRFCASQWNKPLGPTPDWRWTSGLGTMWTALLHLPAIALCIFPLERRQYINLRAFFLKLGETLCVTWRVKSISRRATSAELHRYDDLCGICLSRLWFGARLFHQHCQHIFHERCLVDMVSLQSTTSPMHCPTCRQVLLVGNEEPQSAAAADVEQPRLAEPERPELQIDPRLRQYLLDYEASLTGGPVNQGDGGEHSGSAP